MREFQISAYGVEELSHNETKKIKGGFWPFVGAALLSGLLYDVVFHWGDTAGSYNKGADAANDFWSKQ